MLLIRRLWLLPTLLATVGFYYLFYPLAAPHILSFLSTNRPTAVRLLPRPERFPVTSFTPLPPGEAKVIPRVQFDFSSITTSAGSEAVRIERQNKVKDAFLHAWEGYKKYAWGQDEVAPLSGQGRSSFGGWGATLVDSMDSLWMMGLKDEFDLCVKHVQQLDFTTHTESILNVFETTIRYLGGLLAAYDISEHKYPVLLNKAKELGDVLYMAFDTPSRLPVTRWEWRRTAAGLDIEVSTSTLIAELASLDLEFTKLTQLTGDAKYFDAVDRISKLLEKAQHRSRMPGLWPTVVHLRDPDHESAFGDNHFTFGGMVDSAYEYLPKQYMLLGGLDRSYHNMYDDAIEVAKRRLFYRPLVPDNEDILFSGNAGITGSGKPGTEYQGQHLACFVGGMVGIASRIFDRPEELSIARKLVDGCIWAYDRFPHGLMPEIMYITPCHAGVTPEEGEKCVWDEEKWYSEIAEKHGSPEAGDEGGIDVTAFKALSKSQQGRYWAQEKQLQPPFTHLPDNRYILRPEAIESVFILYRITGDKKLLDAAWRMFESIEAATRTEVAHAGVFDVTSSTLHLSDRMESFWLAETLKYFHLIFGDPSEWSLDDWVFNTEAHPLRRPTAGQPL